MRKIDEIWALCEAATPGPWDINGGCLCVPRQVAEDDWECDQLTEFIEGEGNRAFIAASREFVPDLLDALAEKDAEIEKLREDAGDEVDRLQALISAGEVEIRRLKTEIELWKTADSKAVATARRQIDKLWEALEGAWHQFAYVDGNGKRWCGGLSALEEIADALGLDV